MTDPLKRPLVFGDQEQIDALRQAERQAEFNALTPCSECEGYGCCSKCDQDCPKCDGLGKDLRAIKQFEKTYPSITGFQLWELRRK